MELKTSPKQGEAEFRALIERHSGALGRIVRHYEVVPEERQDLEQEILMGIWKAMETFRGESSEKTWIFRIAHNIAATHVARAVRARHRLGLFANESVPSPRPDVLVEERVELQRLDARLRALELPMRQLVMLALEGCTTAEIAAITGLSPTNVTTRLHRIRKQLSEEQ